MKTAFFRALCLAGLCSATARANDILVYKITAVSTFTAHGVYFPDTPDAEGGPAFSGKFGSAGYAVIELGADDDSPGAIHHFELETDSVAYAAVDMAGNPVVAKKRFFTTPEALPLNERFDKAQPLKAKDTVLWNFQTGGAYGEPGAGTTYESGANSEQITGVATPFAVTKSLTIPGVPRTLKGTEIIFGHYHVAPSADDPDPSLFVVSGVETSTWTLDTTLTKAANTAAIPATADLNTVMGAPDVPGVLAAGTLRNGVQRVRNLIYGTGYRLGGEIKP